MMYGDRSGNGFSFHCLDEKDLYILTTGLSKMLDGIKSHPTSSNIEYLKKIEHMISVIQEIQR